MEEKVESQSHLLLVSLHHSLTIILLKVLPRLHIKFYHEYNILIYNNNVILLVD